MKAITVLKFLSGFLAVAVVFSEMMVMSGCANIIPPSGGPRDSLPPVLVKATPPDSTLNFRGNRIHFTFNEFINLESISSNLIVSPVPASLPVVDYRLNTMTVKFREMPEPNTTYTLNFGHAIRDFNEGNVLPGFSYVFSTGPAIDTLQLRGRVVLAETGKTDSTLIVMLHTDGHDSAVVKQRPRYFTKLDAGGNFIFRNLPPGTFYVYALQDQGGSLRYLDSKQLFAFSDTAIKVEPGNKPITLYAYADKPPVPAVLPTLRGRASGADRRIRFTTTLTDRKQDILEKFRFTFEQPLMHFDSSLIAFSTDSAFHPVSGYFWKIDSARKTVTLHVDWKENTLYHLVLQKDFAEDSSGRKLLLDDTLSFHTRKKSDYGSLRLRFRHLDLNKNPVLQLLQGNMLKKSIPFRTDEIYEELFYPGEYELRILYDTNRNGQWDPGRFFGLRRQPEIVQPVERKINVKAGVENEFEIAL